MKSLSPAKPHLIVMVGVPGSGKSFFAEKFAETFGAPYINYEKLLPLTTSTNLALAIHLLLDELLKTRQSILIEGLSDTRTERIELARKARTNDYEVLFVWMQTDTFTAKHRSTKTHKNKLNRTLSDEEFERATKRFTQPNTAENPIVLSGKHTYATQAKVVLKKLSAPRAEMPTTATTPQPRRSSTAKAGRRSITIR